MKTIKDVLAQKGSDVVSIYEDQTVYDAIKFLVENNIGAVLVRNGKEEVVGLISERDILREGEQRCEKLKEIPVKSVMTRNLIVCEPGHTIEYAEHVMVKNRIRHLPVISNHKLVGILSMRDIVRARLNDAEVENRYLLDYIEGKYPG
jgi:CBS domain-containing protein